MKRPVGERIGSASGTMRGESGAAGVPRIRPARASDLPAVEHLLASAKLPTTGVRESLHNFLVAVYQDGVVGVAGLELCEDNALLRSVAVLPAWRAQGVGRALVTRVIAVAEARRVRALYLLTTTAEGYFQAFDFRALARDAAPPDIRATAEFRTACPATAAVMWRPMSSPNA